jgi:sugar lactone lactonase YvrE/uncharacterized coiled-coil protein SlyX
MKKIFTAFFASLMLAAFSTPSWANGAQQCPKKKVTHHERRHHGDAKHNHKALKQFRHLQHKYNSAIEDARKMFLEYLGSSLPCADTDVEAIRSEYEQQIGQLNETNGSQQQQITELNATIVTQQQQLAELNATLASQQQQLADQAATHQQEMEAKDQQCAEQLDTAYNDGVTAGMETCETAWTPTEPQLSSTWSTGSYYPYALDVDSNGNTYIVERNYRSVVGYDSSGSQIAAWGAPTLVYPVDLGVDSNGDIFILDQGSMNFLQKFSPNGEKMAFTPSGASISYAMSLFIDSQDNIYVTDAGGLNGGRVLKFDSTGALLATFGEVTDPALSGDEYSDIAVDEANQTIYVVTRYNHMVAKFSMDGTYQGAWAGDLRYPNSIAIGSHGQVFVADTYNNQIDQYDADGGLAYTVSSAQLNRPSRMVVDSAGKLYIAVESYHSVLVYQE